MARSVTTCNTAIKLGIQVPKCYRKSEIQEIIRLDRKVMVDKFKYILAAKVFSTWRQV